MSKEYAYMNREERQAAQQQKRASRDAFESWVDKAFGREAGELRDHMSKLPVWRAHAVYMIFRRALEKCNEKQEQSTQEQIGEQAIEHGRTDRT